MERYVNANVIEATSNLVLEADNDKPTLLRWLRLDEEMEVDHLNAIYLTGFLHGQQEQLNQELTESRHSSPQRRRRTIGLEFDGVHLTDNAVDIFCDLLQQDTCPLSALDVNLPAAQCRRIFHALHTNTSVKKLSVFCDPDDNYQEDELGRWISELLRHKTDFEKLFGNGPLTVLSILPFLRGGHSNVKSLGFDDCGLVDDDVQLLVQALVDGNHNCLEELILTRNYIMSRGLGFLCALTPSAFPCLKRLYFNNNHNLLDDPVMAQRFAQEVLLVPLSMLEELYIPDCGTGSEAYRIILKALETNRSLLSLDIAKHFENARRQEDVQLIRDQLIESVPKMKTIQHLVCDEQILNANDQELMRAFYQNSSFQKLSFWNDDGLEQVSVTTPLLIGILKRNRYLWHVDKMLGTGPIQVSQTGTIIRSSIPVIPRALWTDVLAKVGDGSSNGSNTQGASPVFKILQARLASWPETNEIATTNNASKKRKCQEDADDENK